MSNPTPKTEQLKPHQYQSKGDVPMSKPIPVRFPVDVREKLDAMENKSDFIRAAVEKALAEE